MIALSKYANLLKDFVKFLILSSFPILIELCIFVHHLQL
jgi:hypothetical protein